MIARAGDVESGYSWNESLEKFRRVPAPAMPEDRVGPLAEEIRHLGAARQWPLPEVAAALAELGA